jgi:hypothetical protein
MTVDAIQDAIKQLPEPERRRLADWLEGLEAQAWDEQIERDFSPGGPGIPFLEEVKREIAEGKTQSFEEGLRQFHKSRQ